ncbi:MAG: 2-hydroxyacyl-CoA dehydratase [Candidatus Helarchaeota archaeon]
MGRLSEDLVLNTGFLNIGMKFFDIIRNIKRIRRKKYRLIGTKYPIFNEIIYSTNAFPLFTIRVPAYGEYDILKRALSSTRLAEDVFGKKLASRGVSMVSDLLDQAILKQSDQLFKNFSSYASLAENTNLDMPCYSTKLFYGSILKNKDIIDNAMVLNTPCNTSNRSNRFISDLVNDIIIINAPESAETDLSLDFFSNEVQQFILRLEQLAGPINEDLLKNYTELINKIKMLYWEFFELFKRDNYLPIAPQSFRFMLSMLNTIYVDLIFAPNYVYKNLLNLNKHLIKQKNEGKGYNASNSLRILLLPSLGGFEYSITNYLAEKNVFLFYFDFFFYKLLEPIQTTGDWVKNQAKFIQTFYNSWATIDNVINEWLIIVKNLEIDGVIFNDIIGCDYLSCSKQYFEEKLQQSNIKYINIPFNRIGENIKSTEKMLDSFIKNLKN